MTWGTIAATVRTAVACLFSEPEVFLPVGTNLSGTMSKNRVLSMLPIKRNGYFPILRNFVHSEWNDDILLSSCDGKFWHKDVLLQSDESCLWIDESILAWKLGLWGSTSNFAFLCRASTTTSKWRSFMNRIQLNNSSSAEVGYDNGLPAPLAFPFHAFPSSKPPCLLISGGPAL